MSLYTLRISLDSAIKIRTTFHVVAAIHHTLLTLWFALLDRSAIKNQQVIDALSFADRYLTGWNFAMQVIFLIIALFCDYTDLRPQAVQFKFLHKVKKFRDFFFTALVFPGTMFVSSMFWILWTIDREMVLAEACDQFIPIWVHHSTHSWIVPVVLIEIIVQPRTKPKNEISHIVTLHGYQLIYAFVLLATYFTTGRWIYPVYVNMTWFQRFLYLTLIFTMGQVFYDLGWNFNDLLWKKCSAVEDITDEEEDDPDANKKNAITRAMLKARHILSRN